MGSDVDLMAFLHEHGDQQFCRACLAFAFEVSLPAVDSTLAVVGQQTALAEFPGRWPPALDRLRWPAAGHWGNRRSRSVRRPNTSVRWTATVSTPREGEFRVLSVRRRRSG